MREKKTEVLYGVKHRPCQPALMFLWSHKIGVAAVAVEAAEPVVFRVNEGRYHHPQYALVSPNPNEMTFISVDLLQSLWLQEQFMRVYNYSMSTC